MKSDDSLSWLNCKIFIDIIKHTEVCACILNCPIIINWNTKIGKHFLYTFNPMYKIFHCYLLKPVTRKQAKNIAKYKLPLICFSLRVSRPIALNCLLFFLKTVQSKFDQIHFIIIMERKHSSRVYRFARAWWNTDTSRFPIHQ